MQRSVTVKSETIEAEHEWASSEETLKLRKFEQKKWKKTFQKRWLVKHFNLNIGTDTQQCIRLENSYWGNFNEVTNNG